MKYAVRFLATVLLVLAAADAWAEERVELPDTPAGRQAQELLQVLQAGDRDTISAFIEQNFAPSFLQAIPLGKHVELNLAFVERTGGLVPQQISSSSATKLRFVGRAIDARTQWQVGIEVQADPPHRIVSLGFMRPQPWAKVGTPAVPEEPLTSEELAGHLDAFLQALAKADAFSGAVLVARGDEILFHQAYGLASRAWSVPNRIDTKFNLGSMNKMFTAVAIAQLVEQGKLSLDDTIARHLPEYPNADVAGRVTVRQLLGHTSGLGSYFNDQFMKTSRDQLRNVSDFVPLFADEPLQFEPGSRFGYSNAGFVVLGLLIEKLSGEEYSDYVRTHVCQPAGMTNTDTYELDRDVPNLAVGYTREESEDEGHWKNNLFLHVIKGGPAGGGYSTVEDLFRFAQALRQDRLIRPETLDLLTQSGVQTSGYGLGFEVFRAHGRQGFGHRGGFPGISGMLWMERDAGYTIAVLSNVDSGVLPVSDRLGELLPKIGADRGRSSDQ